MASVAHCLYCFDVLGAYLDDREPLSLAEVQDSWVEYCQRETAADQSDIGRGGDRYADLDNYQSREAAAAARRIPALRRLAASSSSSSSLPGPASPSTGSSSSSSASSSLAPSGVSTPGTSTTSLPGAAAAATTPADAEYPLFVTWNKMSRRGHASLRGCVGTFEEQPLSDALASYAITSAMHDTRFDPVERAELASLEVAVTLLTDFEDASGPEDWTLGTHGLRIAFTHHGRRYGATYLPDVAVEQGWTKEETVINLMRKAGWVGSRSRWREVELRTVRYQGNKKSVGYGEYKKWAEWQAKDRKWGEGTGGGAREGGEDGEEES